MSAVVRRRDQYHWPVLRSRSTFISQSEGGKQRDTMRRERVAGWTRTLARTAGDGGAAVSAQDRKNLAEIGSAAKAGLLAEVNKGALARLVREGQVVVLKKGQRLFNEGETLKHLFLILAGRMKLTKTDVQGRQLLMMVLGPGTILGVPSIYAGSDYFFNADMLDAGRVLRFEPRLFRELMEDQRGLSYRVIEHTAFLLKDAWERNFSNSIKYGRERLAEEILKKLGPPQKLKELSEPVSIRLNRTELAEMTGMAKETVSRLLKGLAHKRAVSIHGREVRVLSIRLLAQIAGLPL